MLALRPTFSESWYRVANLRVRLRPGAEITRQFHRGERWYVVRDPAGTQFMRLSDGAYMFIGLLDGKRTVAEAWDLAGGQLDDAAPTQPEVIQILSQLHAANLVEADITPDADVLLKRYKAMQRRQWKQRAMSALFPRIPIPNKLLNLHGFVSRWMPVARVLMSKGGMVLWLITVLAALVTIAPSWDALWKQSNDALAFNNWIWLWAVFVFTKVIHEFGHAFACRKFGGEVHEMGVMFLVFVPTPYVDASSAWGFPSRWQRIFVGAAGMYTELFFAAIMAFVWKFTSYETHPVINGMAYNAMLVASVSTVLFNANPLLRYDGYYMLSDFLEIPNLQQKSKEYGWGLIKRHVFKVKQMQELPSIKQRIWLFNYWWTSSIYRVFIGLMIILIVSDKVPVLGTLMALGGLVTWCVMPTVTLFRYLTIEPELHRKRTRAWAFTVSMAAVVIVLVGLIKIPVRVSSEAILEPERRQVLRANFDGFVKVDGVKVADQAQVKAGDVLVEMENPTLQAEIEQVQAKLRGAELRRQLAVATDQTQRAIEEEQLKALRLRLADLRKREEDLTIRAPFDARFISPQIHTLAGQYLKRGQEFALVATLDRLEARAVIDQGDSNYIDEFENWATDEQASLRRSEIRLVSDVSQTLYPSAIPIAIRASAKQLPHQSLGTAGGGQAMVDPKDQQGVTPVSEPFEVVLKIDNGNMEIVPGQRAQIQFVVDRRPILAQGWRRLLQLIQMRDLHSQW